MPFLAWKLKILVVAGKSRRHGMAPAHAMVFLSQKPGTKDGIILPTLLFLAWMGTNRAPCTVGWWSVAGKKTKKGQQKSLFQKLQKEGRVRHLVPIPGIFLGWRVKQVK